jgi:hypothetical protein
MVKLFSEAITSLRQRAGTRQTSLHGAQPTFQVRRYIAPAD